MPALSAEGIILRKYFLRETSYILVVFTREFGKIRGVLKGARNPYPQFAGNFELFAKCDLLFYKKKKKNMDLITRCEASEFFLPVRKDIERLTYACYFIELIDAVTHDYDVNGQLYQILVEGMRLLETEASPKRTARIFELKLVDAVGFGPQLEECVRCSSSEGKDFYFSINAGGIVCRECIKQKDIYLKISPGTLNFLRKIRGMPFSKTARIKVSRDVGKETEVSLKKFIQYYIGRQAKSMKFLEEIEKKKILQKV